MGITAIRAKLKAKSLKRHRRGRIEILPPELKSKKARLEIVRKVVNDDKTQLERKQESQKITKRCKTDVWNWTTSLDQAAFLIAEDRMSLKDVEEKTGVATSRLKRMLTLIDGEFTKRVEKYRQDWITKLKNKGSANRDIRINVLDEMHDKLVQIYRDRAKFYKNKKHPGVNTGMMIRTIKAVGHGPKAKFVRGWELDKDLTKEIREIELQMAKELGQWSEKTENTNTVLVREYAGVDTSNV